MITIKSSSKFSDKEAGFTLIELVIVVAVLGILVAIAIPTYGAIRETAARNATNQLAKDGATTTRAIYESKGAEAAAEVINNNNAEDSGMFYLVYNVRPGTGVDGLYRSHMETPFKASPELFTTDLIKSDALFTAGLIDQGGDGSHLCSVAFYAPGEQIEHIGFAGPACGPSDGPGVGWGGP